ncbi:MAG: hypothetical protein HY924_04550 [Elusimicrobia bacterium]|nr:hypothetical protein [Elusimicrobiota bacterium]
MERTNSKERLVLALLALVLGLSVPAKASGFDAAASDFSETPAPRQRPSCRDSACSKQRGQAEALAAQASTLSRHGQAGKALALIQEASRLDPDSAEILFLLGDAHHSQALAAAVADKLDPAHAKAAVAAYEKAAALDPRLASLSEPFSFYTSLEECRQAVGDTENALKANLKSIEVSRQNFMPRLQRAALHYSRQEWNQSAAELYASVRAARTAGMYGQFARLVRVAPRFAAMLDLPQNKIILDTFDSLQAKELSEGEAEEQILDYVDASLAAKDEPQVSEQTAQAAPAPETSGPAPVLIASLDRGDPEWRDSLNDPSLPGRAPGPEDQAAVIKDRIREGDEAFKAGKLKEAVVAYESALSVDLLRHSIPLAEEARLFETVGSAYRRLGLYREALRSLKKALDSPLKRASAYYELSLYCAATDDLDRSLAFLEKAIRTASSDAELRAIVREARSDEGLAGLRKSRAAHFAGLLRLAARRS